MGAVDMVLIVGRRPGKLLLAVGMVTFICSIATGDVAMAQGANAVISQGYKTAVSGMSTGELVSLESNPQDTVRLANTQSMDLLVGVVENRPLVSLSSGSSNVQVATSGVASALVSDFNGTVHLGDKITASPINGVGMRATVSGEIVGMAQTGMSTVQTVPFTITSKYGVKHTVHIGLIALSVGVAYDAAASGQSTSILPSVLQRIANDIAGRDVSVVRVLISLLIVLLGFVSTAVILNSSIRSGITSVGRNPLAARAIHNSLLQVVFLVVGIMLAMLVGAYVVLAT